MDESRINKDSHPYRIGEDSDVTQETEIIQSGSVLESGIDFMDPNGEDLDFNVIEIDDICCVYGPPDDIVEFDDDLFDTETETIDKISFVYGPWKSPVCVTPEAQVPLTLESKFRMTPIKS